MVLTFLFLLIETQVAYSQRTKSSASAGNQRRSEKSLKDHQYFFYFIDPTITNSGDDKERALLIEATRRDLIARMLYMRFEFNPAMKEIINTQKLLITLYSNVAVREVESATTLLNDISTEILTDRDNHAKHYIALGYRSVDSAKKTMIMSDNFDETNYSVRIYEYVKAIKSAKYSKRYAIIALIDHRVPLEKSIKIDYNNYDVVKDLINQYIPENAEAYNTIHFDNFYKIDPAKSVYDSVRNNPELEKIPEYKEYFKDHK
jgi:hypothetical protein